MGRRNPRPSLSKLIRLGSALRLPRSKASSENMMEEDPEQLTITSSTSPEKAAAQRIRCDSDRSTASTASSHTTKCPLQDDDDDDEDLCGVNVDDESLVISPDASVDSTCCSSATNHPPTCSSNNKHVRFGTANIRVYPQILGDHPYCSQGCPLELDWQYTSESSVPALECGKEQNQWCSKLTAEQRLQIIQPKYSEQEVRKACRRQSRQCEQTQHKKLKLQHQQFFFGGKPLNTV